MKVLLDTSILIAGFIESHTKHEKAMEYFKKALKGKISVYVASHSIAECYAVLTRIPVIPKISPTIAYQIIAENISKIATLISISESEYLSVLKELSELGLSGGIVYDAIILKSAQKAKVDKLLTLNPRDFIRLSLGNEKFILEL